MITELNSINLSYPSIYGNEIIWLKTASDHGLKIIDSIIIPNTLFEDYYSSNQIDDCIINDLIKLIKNKFNYTSITLRVSSFSNDIGILTNIKTYTDFNQLKITIQSIYQSWSDVKSRAYRTTYHIKNEDSYPALIIQPYFNNLYSLVTRCPRTGLPTNQENISNIHNKINKFEYYYKYIVNKIELITKKPSKIFFIEETNSISIVGIKKERMSDHAIWVSLNDLLTKNYIDELYFLEEINPNMISRFNHIDIDLEKNSGGLVLKGINASPGQSEGKLIFPDTKIKSLSEDERYIFCCNYIESVTHDIPLFKSIGAISSDGGRTSHLAVICRGLRIPAVVGIDNIKILEKNKKIIINDKFFTEYCHLLVNGSTGKVFISNIPLKLIFKEKFEQTSSIEELKRLAIILEKYNSNFEIFSNLPLDKQWHLSELKSRLNKIDFN